MIKIVHFLRRHPSLSLEQFVAHSLDETGPRVAFHQSKLGMLRHVRTWRDISAQTIDDPARRARGGMEEPFDGLAETWWPSMEAATAALTSGPGQRIAAELLEDEHRFVDLANSPIWIATEHLQVGIRRDRTVARPKTGVMKLCLALRPLPRMSQQDAQTYWLTTHGPLVRSHAVARGMICYQQAHAVDSELGARLRRERGVAVDGYAGHAEAWFDRLDQRSGVEIDNAGSAALDDERNFIDWNRSNLFTGKEAVFVDRDWV